MVNLVDVGHFTDFERKKGRRETWRKSPKIAALQLPHICPSEEHMNAPTRE